MGGVDGSRGMARWADSDRRARWALRGRGKITTRVKGYPAVRSTITRIESPRLWIGVAKQPGLTMTYEHVIEPAAGGTVLTERAILTGPFATLMARLLGRRLESTITATTAHCAALAEARAAAP